MTRAAKKGLTRSQMRAVIVRWGKARAALREMYLEPQPDNYRDIVNEHDTADAAVGAMLNRVLVERAELVKALNEAIAGADSSRSEIAVWRAVAAKYEVKP